MAPEPPVSASTWNLLDMKILQVSSLNSAESENLEWGPASCINQLSRGC